MAVKRAIIEYMDEASQLEDACIIYKPRSDFIIGVDTNAFVGDIKVFGGDVKVFKGDTKMFGGDEMVLGRGVNV